jgi:hypothetical protein
MDVDVVSRPLSVFQMGSLLGRFLTRKLHRKKIEPWASLRNYQMGIKLA